MPYLGTECTSKYRIFAATSMLNDDAIIAGLAEEFLMYLVLADRAQIQAEIGEVKVMRKKSEQPSKMGSSSKESFGGATKTCSSRESI